MSEIVRFYPSDGGPVLDLTGNNAYILRSRTGIHGPPTQVYSERLPVVEGDRYLGSQANKRTIGISFLVPAATWDELQENLAITSDAFFQGGVLESVVNGRTRRITVIYSSGLENVDTSQRVGMRMPIVVSLVAMQPYWEDPEPQTSTLNMATSPNGVIFPATFPVFFGVRGSVALTTITAGNVGSPLRITVVGPFTRFSVQKRRTGEIVDIVYALPAGQQVTWTSDIRDPVAPRRVLVDTGQTVINATYALTSQSTFFDLDAKANQLIVRVQGGVGPDVHFRWTDYSRSLG